MGYILRFDEKILFFKSNVSGISDQQLIYNVSFSDPVFRKQWALDFIIFFSKRIETAGFLFSCALKHLILMHIGDRILDLMNHTSEPLWETLI